MSHQDRPTIAALFILIVLQLIMLSALYAGVPPHPPVATPLFGIAPFIGASIAIAGAAIILGPLSTAAGRSLTGLAIVLALISFGPQKILRRTDRPDLARSRHRTTGGAGRNRSDRAGIAAWARAGRRSLRRRVN